LIVHFVVLKLTIRVASLIERQEKTPGNILTLQANRGTQPFSSTAIT
jgi:hypothetical protein